MKQCLNCFQVFEDSKWHCPRCGFRTLINGNLLVFAPKLAHNNSGFNVSYYGLLATLEGAHFWFLVRNDLIIWALGKYGTRITSFMEIGCGTGFVLQGISRCFPEICLTGSEIYIEGLSFAAERIVGGRFMQMDARQIPFVSEFDSIGAFDVIEHIEEDGAVLKQIYRALKPQGLLLLTVPQHRWLWSTVDENARHIRRYTARELHNKLRLAGFTIVRSTSFVTSLLPLMFIARLFQRKKRKNFNPFAELQHLNPLLNRIFEVVLRLEFLLIRMGFSFPAGGSILVVATKIKKNNPNA